MATGDPRTYRIEIRAPIARGDLPGLYDRVCAELAGAPRAGVDCDVRAVEADAVTVDALARLQLGARRHGREVRLVNASDELLALVQLMGLADVLPG